MDNTSDYFSSNPYNFVFLILASGSPEHVRDEYTQRQTWAKRLPSNARAIWLRGNSESDFTLEDSTLWVPCEDIEILKKTILGIDWLLENSNFTHVIRSNVSTYFNVEIFMKKIVELGSRDYVAGFLERTAHQGKPSDNQVFVSGAAICFPRSTALTLTRLHSAKYQSWPDDVALSHFASTHGVRQLFIPRSNLGYHHLAIPSSYIRCKSSSNSSLASLRMILLEQFFSTKLPKKPFVLLRLQVFEILHSTFKLRNLINYIETISNLFRSFIRYRIFLHSE